MHRFHSLFLLLCISLYAHTQTVSIAKSEITLQGLFNRLYSATNDARSEVINDSICTMFSQTFTQQASFDYPFDSLRYVGKVYSNDQALRIYSWNYITQSGGYHFDCFIQRKQDNAVFRLKQPMSVYIPQEQGKILPNNWYGALYYSAIPYKYKKKRAYLLLGWSRYSESRNFKMIDVLSFENNQIRLGDPIFQADDAILSRVTIPYSSRYALTLQYNEKGKMIIFNHLHINTDKSNESTAIPDENFSAYLLTKSGLKFKSDLPLKDKQVSHSRPHFKIPDSVE